MERLDFQIFELQERGFSYSSILNMEIVKTQKFLKLRKYDEYNSEMIDKIELYRMHGIEPTDQSKMGTTLYRDFINKKQIERDKEFMRRYKEKHGDKIKKKEINIKDKIAEMKNG